MASLVPTERAGRRVFRSAADMGYLVRTDRVRYRLTRQRPGKSRKHGGKPGRR